MNFSPLKNNKDSKLNEFRKNAPKIKCDSSIERSLEQINKYSTSNNDKVSRLFNKNLWELWVVNSNIKLNLNFIWNSSLM